MDWKKIDWKNIDENKARFIYNDCLAFHKEILGQISKTKSKAYMLISVVLPIILAIAGYTISQWHAVAKNAMLYYLPITGALLYTILMVLVAKVVMSTSGHLAHLRSTQYFAENKYYEKSLRDIYLGNIGHLYKVSNEVQANLSKLNKTTDYAFVAVTTSPAISLVLTAIISCVKT